MVSFSEKNASNVRERKKTIRKTYLFLSIQITGIFHFSPIEQQYFDYFLFIERARVIGSRSCLVQTIKNEASMTMKI